MRKSLLLLLLCAGLAGVWLLARSGPDPRMSFFVTSHGPGQGGNLGGLAGADRWCATLADAVGVRGKLWAAYLSTRTVDARDRIGPGPWVNAGGVTIAESVAALHGDGNRLGKATALDETGAKINGRGQTPLRHDMLTGTLSDGTRAADTCADWTSSDAGVAMVGHHDGRDLDDSPSERSWNAAHLSHGCSLEALRETGDDGLFYCFAVR